MIRNIFVVLAVCASVVLSFDIINTCVSRKELIEGEQAFLRGSLPWNVALMKTWTVTPKSFCSGTLISQNFVISGKLLIQADDSAIISKNFQLHVVFSTPRAQPKDLRLRIFLKYLVVLCDNLEAGKIMQHPIKIFIHSD